MSIGESRPRGRDRSLLAESEAIRTAVGPYHTLAALHAAPEWPSIRARLDRLLGTIRRHARPESGGGMEAGVIVAGGTEVGATPPPAAIATPAAPVRAVHWNIEHGNRYEQIEKALLEHRDLRDADLYFFNEIDLGMARAGNRDVTADLAASLDRYGVWAPLFLESTLGRDDDETVAAGRANEESLFGLAILSRWPIGDARLVDLPSAEAFLFASERILGRHIALVARIERPGSPFLAVSTHLEVHRTRAHRSLQMRMVLDALREETLPVILAGDFNSHTFDRRLRLAPMAGAAALLLTTGGALERRFLYPDRGPNHETLFDELACDGFEWNRFVDRAPTLRIRLDRLDEVQSLFGRLDNLARKVFAWAEERGRLRLDWFAGRGWRGGTGSTVPGLDGPGKASDHAPIRAEFM